MPSITKQNPPDEFRDHLSTVDPESKRVWVYPKKPKGKLYTYRKYVSYLLLALLFAGPYIKVNGLPLLMLNLVERKFVILGVLFWPQDFFLLVLAFLAMALFVILFTVVYGRVFCGWVCPQTIFLEMVFRRIEYAIEGDYTRQKALNKMPWNVEKLLKKGSKTILFIFISFLISNTFLAYIIGADALLQIITDNPLNHLSGLGTIVFFTGIFYGVFAWFREQVCTIACPYGRLQGVMLDKKTLVVAYDYKRGEPRRKQRRNEERTQGDCIDCKQCVHVCPTGIDIRNGTQLECINCTACIDACNDIMRMINKPEGLIQIESEEGIETGSQWKFFTPRVLGYSAVLTILLTALTTLLLTRDDAEATILRTPGQLYQQTEKGTVRNLYNISVINKTNQAMPLTLKLLSHKGTIDVVGGDQVLLPAQGIAEGVFFTEIPLQELESMNARIEVGLYFHGRRITTQATKFLAPAH
ncbi:cytochrome c oxidase accessory protein CcoG [Pontibacter oryzae]|uniref:Cytochrome c oxidase accessory protein CcoG n=1 Tax=Pontibacter oryzae TaxID=2304593 RepID=A0A399SEV1_9BACT|nr:cytochrome c oxidase accessory protein CcoG [Pontibacter oryzae]RIJ41681.1 cytochrome c oxidase accessory protein CcoG [Pontibacter oryzae]